MITKTMYKTSPVKQFDLMFKLRNIVKNLRKYTHKYGNQFFLKLESRVKKLRDFTNQRAQEVIHFSPFVLGSAWVSTYIKITRKLNYHFTLNVWRWRRCSRSRFCRSRSVCSHYSPTSGLKKNIKKKEKKYVKRLRKKKQKGEKGRAQRREMDENSLH